MLLPLKLPYQALVERGVPQSLASRAVNQTEGLPGPAFAWLGTGGDVLEEERSGGSVRAQVTMWAYDTSQPGRQWERMVLVMDGSVLSCYEDLPDDKEEPRATWDLYNTAIEPWTSGGSKGRLTQDLERVAAAYADSPRGQQAATLRASSSGSMLEGEVISHSEPLGPLLAVGARVVVVGKPGLTGQRGVVQGTEGDRVLVGFAGGESKIAIRPDNLRLVTEESSPSASPTGGSGSPTGRGSDVEDPEDGRRRTLPQPLPRRVCFLFQ